MANTKISDLTSATTPLAGTETLPVVQSGTTKQVSVDNLTVGRATTLGSASLVYQTGTAGNNYVEGEFKVGGVNSSVGAQLAYAAQSSGYVSLVNLNNSGGANARIYFGYGATTSGVPANPVAYFTQDGNLIPTTAAKGVNFTANTGAAGMTSQLLNWYEEGTFTPTYGGSTTNPTVTYSEQVGYYTRIGRLVTIGIRLVVTSATGGSGNLRVNGLPFTGLGNTGGLSLQFVLGFASNVLQAALSGTSLVLYDTYAGTSNTQSPVSALTSAGGTTYLVLGGTYMV